MFFKKKQPPPPPCHFRQFVAMKESWPAVLELLKFKPKTNHLSLRKQSIDEATKSAIKSSYLLLAADLFDLVTKNDIQLQSHVGEEPIALECLAFSSSFICNKINPESEDYEIYLDARNSIIESMSFMSLIANEDIENTFLTRFDMYDNASKSNDREEFISDIFARILTYLKSGEHFTRIQIRYEDPANIAYRIIIQDFISYATKRLKEMVHLIVKRETEEEEYFEIGTPNNANQIGDIEDQASRYHEQIETQIESSYKFLQSKFGESSNGGQYSLKTLSVFIVHTATILAINRNFPWLHETTINGFTRTLSFLTPNTMPTENPPSGMLISYCSDEESFMHEQSELFEQDGLESAVRNLLQYLDGTDSGYNLLTEHIEQVARQASRTYIPLLAMNNY